MIMGIQKETVVTITYVCDNKNCERADKDESLFATDVPVLRNGAKDKLVLCDDCMDEHNEFMARYAPKQEGVQEDDYDPTQDRAFSKYTDEQARHHRAAKLWAVSSKSTMKGNERPKGLKGPAAQKVLAAYETWLKEEKDLADIEAGIAAAKANGKPAA